MSGKLLIIDDEERLRKNLRLLLESEGYEVTTAADGEEGLVCLSNDIFDIVITDIMMNEVNGFQIMEYLQAHAPTTLIIVITGYASTESAIEALRQGAYDYVTKPFDMDLILLSLDRAMEKVKLQQEVKQYTEELELRILERTMELEESNTKLQASLAELKSTHEQLVQSEKLSALGELISGFAHELNNPLSSVLGYSELALGEAVCPDEIRVMLELVCKETHRCYQIVENLLSFARKRKPEKTAVDINKLCGETLKLLSYQLKVNNISITTRYTATMPSTMADAHQIQQVLVNILSNAYQAMAADQGRGQLTITTTHDDAELYITIVDTGPGIASEHMSHLFDPFFTTKSSGTGLGLSLSYGLIKEHGGEIKVSSTLGQGATFVIVLPIATETGNETNQAHGFQEHIHLSQRVLVIDDEPIFAQMLVMAMNKLGHQAEAVLSGNEAFEKLANENYGILFCDLRMPEMDGQQFYHELQLRDPSLCQRMIFTSGDTVSGQQHEFVQESGCLFLRKPFVQKELRSIITQMIVKSRGAHLETPKAGPSEE